MRKSVCNMLKLRARGRPRNGDISLFQRFLKMGASTADCISQRAKSIPELLNHEEHSPDKRSSVVASYRIFRLGAHEKGRNPGFRPFVSRNGCGGQI